MRDATKLRDMSAFAGMTFRDVLAASLNDGFMGEPWQDAGAGLYVAQIDMPLEAMVAVADDKALHVLEFLDRRLFEAQMEAVAKATGQRFAIAENDLTQQIRKELDEYFRGETTAFDTPLEFHGTLFVRAVWHEARQAGRGARVRANVRRNSLNNSLIKQMSQFIARWPARLLWWSHPTITADTTRELFRCGRVCGLFRE